MIHQALLMVFCIAETIGTSTTSRYYDKQKEYRVLANRTNRYDLGQSRSSIKSMECLTKCNQSPACRAVNAFKNGTCEVLLSPVIGVENSVESTAYIGSYKTCPDGFKYPLVARAHGSCYMFPHDLDKWMLWEAARDFCYSVGGDLVGVETAEEMAHINHTVMRNESPTRRGYWTSGRKVEGPGEWMWSSSGGPVDVSFPDRDYVTDGDIRGNCLKMFWSRSTTNSVWSDASCTWPRHTLCEVPLG